jgi:hypothetical protein
MTTTITVHSRVQGLHHWPDAPLHRDYLAHPHRHMFVVTATVAVAHDNRDIEFHDLADVVTEVTEALGKPYHPDTRLIDFGPQSCEQLAEQVRARLSDIGLNVTLLSVSEDGECTATIRETP